MLDKKESFILTIALLVIALCILSATSHYNSNLSDVENLERRYHGRTYSMILVRLAISIAIVGTLHDNFGETFITVIGVNTVFEILSSLYRFDKTIVGMSQKKQSNNNT